MSNTFFTYSLRTRNRNEFRDITGTVRDAIRRSNVKEGICVIHVPHTTAGITINENADPDVRHDMDGFFSKLVPKDYGFAHSEGNSDAHIKTTIFSSSLTVIIHEGAPVLGTWQDIYFCEFDGARSREYHIKCIEG